MVYECDGNIRIRGKRENLIHFLRHELVPVYELKDSLMEERPIFIDENCGGWSLILRRDPDTSNKVYFRGSNRYYIDMYDCDMELEMSEQKNTKADQVICIECLECPWNPDYEFFRQKAIRNKVDIRIFLFGKGKDWVSTTTWYRDGKIEDRSIKYADWLWDNPISGSPAIY